MLKYPLSFLLLISVLSACSKIQPEVHKNINNDIVNIEEYKATKNGKACGIITCEAQDNLSRLHEDWKLILPDLGYYKKRFSIIAGKYQRTDELLESSEFKQFVEDLNIDFFSCKWDIHDCGWEVKKYWPDETNYLFYVFIPMMVIEEYPSKKWKTDLETESIIQSIKRKDFIIDEVKDSFIGKNEEELREKFQKIDISSVDKKKLKEDREYFKQIVLSPRTGLYGKLIDESITGTSWVGVWEDQMEQIMDITIRIFYEKLAELGITEKDLRKHIAIDEVILDLEKNITLMNTKYSLGKKIPIDRFYRNDELYIFNEKNIKDFESTTFWNDKGFIDDVLEIKHGTYLLFLLWKDENMFFLPNRLGRLNSSNNFILTNIFEYSKHANFDLKY